MIQSMLRIRVDKKGNFLGVIYKGRQYSIEEWNQQFLDQPTGDAWDF